MLYFFTGDCVRAFDNLEQAAVNGCDEFPQMTLEEALAWIQASRDPLEDAEGELSAALGKASAAASSAWMRGNDTLANEWKVHYQNLEALPNDPAWPDVVWPTPPIEL